MPNCRCSRCEVDRYTLGHHDFVSFDLVVRSYKDLARVWHPDRFEKDPRLRLRAEEEFKRVQQAFTGLKEHEIDTPAEERFAEIRETTTWQPPPPPSPRREEVSFFPISLIKLTVLSLCTFGLYELYWFYRNWNTIQRRTSTPIRPFWRMVFAPVWCFRCFVLIEKEGRKHGLDRAPAAGLLAVAWILCHLASKLADPWWLITFSSVFFLLPVQAYANRIISVEAPGHKRNSRFTIWNWLVVVVGGSMFSLAIIGAFLPNR